MDEIVEQLVDEIVARCNNPLETQLRIAQSYAELLRYLEFVTQDKFQIANEAIKARWPRGLGRVKKMAWTLAMAAWREGHASL